jgi:hypothetical protein
MRDLQGSLPPEPINESNIGQFEKEAIEKANKAISAIESALAAWDATKEKPEELKVKAERYRHFAEALSGWERKMLLASGKKRTFAERVEMLEEFVDLCNAYDEGGW